MNKKRVVVERPCSGSFQPEDLDEIIADFFGGIAVTENMRSLSDHINIRLAKLDYGIWHERETEGG